MDLEFLELEKEQFVRTDKTLNFIASENLCSENILEACSSIAMCKYSEGFPPTRNEDGTLGLKSRRYYEGCETIDKIESRCQDELLKLFNATEDYYAEVQVPSGSISNLVAYRSILKQGDNVLSCKLDNGSHLTHAGDTSFVSEFYNNIHYGVDKNGFINYDEMEKLAIENKIKLLIVGMSNYSRQIDYKRCREICDKVGCLLMCDISHISGLIATGLHPTCVGLADIITSTTHKILRGPRSAFIIYRKSLDKAVRQAVIPKTLGGANQAITMAKLLCFKEAQTEEYKNYCKQVLKNMKVMADVFTSNNIPILTNSTENHSLCLDLSDFNVTGKEVSTILASCSIITNCNTIPNDPKGFIKTSGVRIGTPEVTTRGLTETHCTQIAQTISDLLIAIRDGKDISTHKECLTKMVQNITSELPLKNIYPNRYRYLFEKENK